MLRIDDGDIYELLQSADDSPTSPYSPKAHSVDAYLVDARPEGITSPTSSYSPKANSVDAYPVDAGPGGINRSVRAIAVGPGFEDENPSFYETINKSYGAAREKARDRRHQWRMLQAKSELDADPWKELLNRARANELAEKTKKLAAGNDATSEDADRSAMMFRRKYEAMAEAVERTGQKAAGEHLRSIAKQFYGMTPSAMVEKDKAIGQMMPQLMKLADIELGGERLGETTRHNKAQEDLAREDLERKKERDAWNAANAAANLELKKLRGLKIQHAEQEKLDKEVAELDATMEDFRIARDAKGNVNTGPLSSFFMETMGAGKLDAFYNADRVVLKQYLEQVVGAMRHKRFGSALTAQEIASISNLAPLMSDDDKSMEKKMDGIRNILLRAKEHSIRRYQREANGEPTGSTDVARQSTGHPVLRGNAPAKPVNNGVKRLMEIFEDPKAKPEQRAKAAKLLQTLMPVDEAVQRVTK